MTVDEAQPVPEEQGAAAAVPPRQHVVVVGWVFGALAVLMVPWTAYLGATLPTTERAAHYALAWAGFDVGLLVCLGFTGWAAIRVSRWLPPLAGATAAMLAVDAWFDVITAPRPTERWIALAMAIVVELPLAALCVWLAVGGQNLLERRVALSVWRRSRWMDRVRSTPR